MHHRAIVVCDTAKVRFFKQITTIIVLMKMESRLFVILQKYDFSSKSQLRMWSITMWCCCLWYCKSTIFQANHNYFGITKISDMVVCDTAKVRFFKQITTGDTLAKNDNMLFVILQKYDFSSKSQHSPIYMESLPGCLWYCKSTIFQANHNFQIYSKQQKQVVCDTAKVRFFKQITTIFINWPACRWLFVILQKYDFSSKSQPNTQPCFST